MRQRSVLGRVWAGAVLAGCLLSATAGHAAPPEPRRPAPSPAVPAAPDPVFETARAVFERLSEADRKSIQDSLVWTGDFSAAPTGSFGRRTYEGIVSYQRRIGQAPTGSLDPASIAALAAAAGRSRAAAGFATTVDALTGIAIGVPGTLLTRRSTNPNGGARWQNRDGRATLDLRAMPGGEPELRDLFERTIADGPPGRVVSYKLLRPDWFVVSGETAAGKFYTRYALGAAGIRAFSFSYDKTLAAEHDRITIAVANSFVPFPSAGVTAPPPGSEAKAAPPGEPATPKPAAAQMSSGLVVGLRRVLTGAPPEGCAAVQVAGVRARLIRSDAARGLALFDIPTRATAGVALADRDLAPDDEAAVIFASADEGGRTVAAPARVSAAHAIVAPLQRGAAGGPILDRTGALAGILGMPAGATRMVAGLSLPAASPFATTAEIRAFLGPDIPAAARSTEPRRLGTIAAEIAPAIVSLACSDVAPAPSSPPGRAGALR